MPGAMHHARWLSKAIYCLKIFLFKQQFALSRAEENALRHICVFLIVFYVKAWYNAPNSIKAPNQDLTLLKNSIEFENVNAAVSQAASSKLLGHLWYLSEELAALAFFDEEVSIDTKLKMVHAIKEREGTEIPAKRVQIKKNDLKTLPQKDISDFITKQSMFLFNQYDLPYDFIDLSPEVWVTNHSFNTCKNVLTKLRVVRHCCERSSPDSRIQLIIDEK